VTVVGSPFDHDEQVREIFIGMLGHDLRTPLSAILSAAAVLRRRARSEEEAKLPDIILRSSRRMARLIQDMLDMSQSRMGGGVRIVREEVDLADIVANAIAEVEGALPSGRFDAQALGDTVGYWDGERLAQVMSNLLSNAVKHGAPFEPVRIRIDGRKEAQVTVQVTNQGAPIPRELLPVIFDPFRRGSPRREARARGVGLGLYITERILSAHAGTVTVRSSAEEGTTFTILLPRSTPPD
jgi:two-component system sensor histidine kinase/response regulator